MDAASWMARYLNQPDQEPMPLQLVNQGFDVWMGSNRGTRYCNDNPRFPVASGDPKAFGNFFANFDKYDYSFYDMGLYD